MSQEPSSDAGKFDAVVNSLNAAYSNNQLDDYRALELKDSFDEQTTCDVQWGPQMRV